MIEKALFFSFAAYFFTCLSVIHCRKGYASSDASQSYFVQQRKLRIFVGLKPVLGFARGFRSQLNKRDMIDYIKGKIVELNPTSVVLETGNIGYSIQISLPVYSALADTEEARLFVHEAIREDAYVLYGFRTQGERQLFLHLISVSGIGPNTARMILSSYSPQEIQAMIAAGDVAALSSIKGIGAKTAQRIIVDLKDKVLKTASGELSGGIQAKPTEGAKSEAVSALVMLGFGAALSQKTVERIIKQDPSLSVEQVIKQALKMM